MNRLIGVTENDNFRTEYEFDNYNNISKEYEIIGAEISKKSYYYDKGNHLLLEDSKSRTVQYEYDDVGNLIKKITGIGSNAESSYYTYDGYNRLSSYIDNITLSEYIYNIDGLRQSKIVNGIKTKYVYDQENIIGEMTEDNIYTYYRATELIGYTSNKGDRYYYRQNSHGDVTALLDTQGNEVKNYTYNAYGKENPFIINPMGEQTILFQWKAETEKIHNPFGYCGEYQDSETGLTYLRNRYYDNSIGRFITEDPIKDGLNWYVYCGNNPIMFVDPSGNIREPGYVNGVWCENPDAYEFGENSITYSSLVTLGQMWQMRTNDRQSIADLANEVRRIHRTVGYDIIAVAESVAPDSANDTDIVIAAGNHINAMFNVLAKESATAFEP